MLIGAIALGVAVFAPRLFSGQPELPQTTKAEAQPQATPIIQVTPTTLNVVGDIEQRHNPDMATFSLGVETTGTTASEASNTNNAIMAAVITALGSSGIGDEQIRSTRISLNPVYARPSRDNPNAPPRINGYRATNTVSVRVLSIDRVGRILDAGLSAGANQVGNITFSLQNMQQPYFEALAEATREAREKAEAIAVAAGMRVSGVITITEETTGAIQPPMARSLGFAESAAARVPVSPGEIVVGARVRVQYRLDAASMPAA